MPETKKIEAAIIIIGNEILSGRTQDTNLQYIAIKLAEKGIYLREVRVIPDVKSNIIATVQELSMKYNYVFTTGGIGPTHDDITTESIAEAFRRKVILNPIAKQILEKYYNSESLNNARLKMACLPEGAELIDNPISAAPGFKLNNVYVFAGVPIIMQAMLHNVLPTLIQGNPIVSIVLKVESGESKIAGELQTIQDKYQDVDIGSYPFLQNSKPMTNIVFRGKNNIHIDQAIADTKSMLQQLSIFFVQASV
ncbi:MAG: competence/damage-inducible protein A [Rhodospirillaceae bacterium]|nr:competence/damage-inducible protein A [Rhodospirillaceae bacterium]